MEHRDPYAGVVTEHYDLLVPVDEGRWHDLFRRAIEQDGEPALERSRAEATYDVRPEGIVVDEIRFLSADWLVHRSTLRGQRIPRAGGDPVPFTTK